MSTDDLNFIFPSGQLGSGDCYKDACKDTMSLNRESQSTNIFTACLIFEKLNTDLKMKGKVCRHNECQKSV